MPLRLPHALAPGLLALAMAAGCYTSARQESRPRASSAAQSPAPAATASAGGTPAAAGHESGGAAPAADAAAPAAAGGAEAKAPDACGLLTSDEIKAVQGEAVKGTKPSRRPDPNFTVALCFYQTPTFSKSVSLELTRRGAGARSVREAWMENFARAEGKRQAKSERRKKAGKPEGAGPARRVEGVGDEAYWVGTSFNGTIYAFKKDALVRISIGGPDKEADRLRKLTTLAQKALARL